MRSKAPAPKIVVYPSKKVAKGKVAKEKVDDPYDGHAKRVHRFEFGSNCKQALLDERGNSEDLIYLETSSGKTTQQLLDCGFKQSNLHPCNRSRTELDGLLEKYPGVVVEHGDMLEIFKEQSWLGAWFDLETTLLLLDVPGQPWDQKRVPEFGRAAVCAVSLPNRGVGGLAEQFAVELQALMQGGSRFLTSPQMARAYSGRSNKQNMVFGLAHYDLQRWTPEDYLHQQVHVPLNFYSKFSGLDTYMLVNNHLVAVVTRVSEAGMLHVKFQSCEGWFFRDEDPEPPLSPATVQAWIVQRSRGLADRA